MDTIRGDSYGAGVGEEGEDGRVGGGKQEEASLEEIMDTSSKGAVGESAAAEAGEEGADAGSAYEAEYAYRAPPGRTRGAHRGYGAASAYYAAGGGGDFNQSEYVLVDAHVLASPVLADINGDGHMEVGLQACVCARSASTF